MTVRHRQNCQKHRITHDQWIRITNPGTRPHKCVSNINMLWDVYHYITDRKLPSGAKAQACI